MGELLRTSEATRDGSRALTVSNMCTFGKAVCYELPWAFDSRCVGERLRYRTCASSSHTQCHIGASIALLQSSATGARIPYVRVVAVT